MCLLRDRRLPFLLSASTPVFFSLEASLPPSAPHSPVLDVLSYLAVDPDLLSNETLYASFLLVTRTAARRIVNTRMCFHLQQEYSRQMLLLVSKVLTLKQGMTLKFSKKELSVTHFTSSSIPSICICSFNNLPKKLLEV